MTAGTRAKARDYSLPERCPLHVVVGFSPRSYSVQYFYETHAGAAVELATGRAGRRATGAAPPDAIGQIQRPFRPVTAVRKFLQAFFKRIGCLLSVFHLEGIQPHVRHDGTRGDNLTDICALATCLLKSNQRLLHAWRLSRFDVAAPKLVELRENVIGISKHLDSLGVVRDTRTWQGPESEVIGEHIQVGARSAATETQGRFPSVDSLGYHSTCGTPQ